jgi:hypothetical protein
MTDGLIEKAEDLGIQPPAILKNIPIKWKQDKTGLKPVEYRGKKIQVFQTVLSGDEVQPKLKKGYELEKHAAPGTYNTIFEQNTWASIHLPLIDHVAQTRYYRELEALRTRAITDGMPPQVVMAPSYDQLWKEALIELYEHSIESDARVTATILEHGGQTVRVWEYGEYQSNDPARFQAALIGLDAVRTARHLSGYSGGVDTDIVVAPELEQSQSPQQLWQINDSKYRYQEIVGAAGMYIFDQKLTVVFPGFKDSKTRRLSRPDLTSLDWSYLQTIFHEIGHKHHLANHACPSSIVKEGFAQVCESLGLHEGNNTIHHQVGTADQADAGRMARIIKKEFEAEYDEWWLTGDPELDNLTINDIYSLSHSMFWTIHNIEQGDDKIDRDTRFRQFVRLISGYDALDANDKYTLVLSDQAMRKRQERRHGKLQFIGGNLERCLQVVYGLDLNAFDQKWKDAVEDSL